MTEQTTDKALKEVQAALIVLNQRIGRIMDLCVITAVLIAVGLIGSLFF